MKSQRQYCKEFFFFNFFSQHLTILFIKILMQRKLPNKFSYAREQQSRSSSRNLNYFKRLNRRRRKNNKNSWCKNSDGRNRDMNDSLPFPIGYARRFNYRYQFLLCYYFYNFRNDKSFLATHHHSTLLVVLNWEPFSCRLSFFIFCYFTMQKKKKKKIVCDDEIDRWEWLKLRQELNH